MCKCANEYYPPPCTATVAIGIRINHNIGRYLVNHYYNSQQVPNDSMTGEYLKIVPLTLIFCYNYNVLLYNIVSITLSSMTYRQ